MRRVGAWPRASSGALAPSIPHPPTARRSVDFSTDTPGPFDSEAREAPGGGPCWSKFQEQAAVLRARVPGLFDPVRGVRLMTEVGWHAPHASPGHGRVVPAAYGARCLSRPSPPPAPQPARLLPAHPSVLRLCSASQASRPSPQPSATARPSPSYRSHQIVAGMRALLLVRRARPRRKAARDTAHSPLPSPACPPPPRPPPATERPLPPGQGGLRREPRGIH
jgi:hypothetical protein